MTAVLCVGLATLDTILAVPRHPGPDDRVVATACVVAGGGPAATAAVALARLGIECAFVGTVGDDAAGATIRDGLAAEGVDVSRLAVVAGGGPAATAAVALARLGVECAFVGAVGDDAAGATIRDGLAAEGVDVSRLAVVAGAQSPQSTILVGPGGARAIVHVPGTAPLEVDDLPEAEWVHVDHVGYPAVRGRRLRLSVDGGNPIPGLDLSEVALYAPTETALTGGRKGAEQETTVSETLRGLEEAARAALAAGAGLVVVTRGGDGSVAATRAGELIVVPAPPDDADGSGATSAQTFSTLGAGDVFHGALLAQLVRDVPLRAALEAANRIAAASCRALDGRSAIPSA